MKKTKSLYIAPLQESAGSVVVALGIMELLVHQMERVAYFRPIIESNEKRDSDIELILGRYGLSMNYEACFGYTLQEAESMIAQGGLNVLLETLLERFGELEREYDFVLIQGLSVTSFSSSLDFNLNLAIAKNIGASVVSVLSGKHRNASEMFEMIRLESHVVATEGCTHFATFVNRLDVACDHELRDSIEGFSFPIFCLPEYPELDKPTMQEIATALNAKRLFGSDEDMNRLVSHLRIAAMRVEHFLEQLQDGDLIITPGDRSDILLGTLVSTYSTEHPNASGILVTGGFEPSDYISGMIQNLSGVPLPMLATSDDTIETATKVLAVQAKLNAKNSRKVALAIGHFENHVDSQLFMERIEVTESQSVTPMMFAYRLFERARASIKHIVLPESNDDRILRATEIVLRRGAVKITLLGEEREILHRSATLGIDLHDVTIVDWQRSALKEEFAIRFYELRKEKGLTLEKARDSMNHLSYFATMMVYCGYVDGMVSGAIHTTQETILPALQVIKTRPDVSLVSSVFFMCLDTKVLVYGDCAINPDPNATELAQIAIASADTAKTFGIEPKVAMLSYSTGTSGKGAEVEKVREATRLVKIARPDLKIDGPIQYDAAVDSVVAAQKLPDSQVAGEANVLIFPDLNTGNNTYKAVQRSSGAVAIGPILQGLNRPVNDLSRGCLVEDIVNTVVITAIQAQKENR